MRFIFLFFTCLLSITTAQAQERNEEFVPEGPRGRWSMDQAQSAALHIIRGEVIATDIEREDDHVYYEFTIRQFDESVFEVEINAANGELYEIEAEYLSENPRLPAGVIEEELAEIVAASYVGEKGKGGLRPKVKNTRIDIWERNLGYDVLVHKGVRKYKVFVDAFSSDVLNFEKLK